MQARSASSLVSLLGSLGLHGCAVLLFVIVARQPAAPVMAPSTLPDAWQGNALEVDALATPEATANIANVADTPPAAEPTSAAAHAPPEPAAEAKPEPPTPREPGGRAAVAPPPPRLPPKVKPKPHTKPAADSAEAAAAHETSGSHANTTAAATGAFGAEGLPPGVRSLPSAFTRAIPPATGADPIWQTLPAGTLPTFTLAVPVDAEGHIGSTQILSAHSGADVPEQFEHLRQRVIALLGGGLFALRNNGVAGTDLFRITITLSERAVKEESEPAELVERGFDAPGPGRAGRAYFTLASGRHFEAKVEVLGQPARPAHP